MTSRRVHTPDLQVADAYGPHATPAVLSPVSIEAAKEAIRRLGDDIVAVPDRLSPHLPALAAHGPALWVAAFATQHTRFNRCLFLNAPQLWRGMSLRDWQQVMLSQTQREHAPGDVYTTGRYDDVKFPCHYVGIDAPTLYFRTVGPGTPARHGQRLWVERHIRACTFMYLPMEDPVDELDETRTTAHDLTAYGVSLMLEGAVGAAAQTEDELLVRLDAALR